MTWTKTETELAAVVVDDLRARGWTVYQEVTAATGAGGVCDIVATMGRMIWAIECKVSLGLPVLAQARNWLGSANLVSVAVLPGRSSDTRRLASDVARHLGIGVLTILGPGQGHDPMYGGHLGSRVREDVRPRLNRKPVDWLRRGLHEQQQTHAPAGNAEGKRFTPFAATCEALRRVLARGPLTVAEAVKQLGGRHHYASEASAKGSIYKWASKGLIDGVEVVREGSGAPVRLRLR